MQAATDTVLGKAVTILRAFGAEDRVLTLAELVRRTGLHKATTHRLCREMVSQGLLDRTEAGYRLSIGLFEIGMRASGGRSLAEVAMPFLTELYDRTHETVHLGVRQGSAVVYVAKLGGHRQARSPSRVGGRMPLHCTAIGKVLLAFSEPAVTEELLGAPLDRRTPHTIVSPSVLERRLAAVREDGVAFEYEESALGVVCVAAPVSDGDEGVMAAVSITGPSGRFHPDRHVGAVRAAASSLGLALQAQPARAAVR